MCLYVFHSLTGILSGNDRNLFTYLPYTSFSSLHDPDFEPVFTIDIGSADVSMCGGDEFCIFDVVATNDTIIGIATSTLAAVSQIEDTTRMSYPGVCVCERERERGGGEGGREGGKDSHQASVLIK